jgi:hypothetical protein
MNEYEIRVPPNEQELSRALREQPLTGAVLLLTVRKIPDELDLQWKMEPVEEETRQFRVGIIDVEQRPTVIHGLVLSGSEIIGAGRIETIGSNDDDSQNTLKLVELR